MKGHSIKTLFIFILTSFVACSETQQDYMDYDIIWGDNYDRFITSSNGLLVPPAVLDFTEREGFIVGLRMASYSRLCGYNEITLFSENVLYFVLDRRDNSLKEFVDRNNFVQFLSIIGLQEVIEDLNTRRISEAIGFFRNYYYSFSKDRECKNALDIERLDPLTTPFRLLGHPNL